MITQLHLKDFLTDTSQSELSYCSLLFKLRSYEHEKQLKEKHINLHLCTPPTRVQSQMQVTVDQRCTTAPEQMQDSMTLTRRIIELEAEVAKAKAQQPASTSKQTFDQLQASGSKKERGKEGEPSRPMPLTQPKSPPSAGFCYRCGEGSHYLQHCTNPVNAALVQQKLVKRHEQRSPPTKVTTPTVHLNLE